MNQIYVYLLILENLAQLRACLEFVIDIQIESLFTFALRSDYYGPLYSFRLQG